MLEIFRGAVALIDEIDWVKCSVFPIELLPSPHRFIMSKVMHPLKSELHWPCGPVRPLDLAEATAT